MKVKIILTIDKDPLVEPEALAVELAALRKAIISLQASVMGE